ncbi:MAG: AMP-binding protein [Actinobacteria bacterium]|nr:AMP-binding protein [Actinomycetota bacterium]
MNLREFFYNNLSNNKSYYFYRGKFRTWKWTYEDILIAALKFATAMQEFGAQKGDRIIIKAPGRPEWIIAFIGCVMSGVVAVPLDYKSDKEFLSKVIEEVQPKLIVRLKDDEETEDINFKHIRQIDIENIDAIVSGKKEFDYKKVQVKNNDLLEIIYTSGTTSAPKGVMLTFGNIESNLQMVVPLIKKWKKFLKYVKNAKLLTVVPLSHMYGQVIGIFIPAAIQLNVIFPESMQPKDVLFAVKKERIIAIGALPQQLKTIKDYIVHTLGLDNAKFSSVFEKFKKKRWWIRLLRFIPLHFKIGPTLLGVISGGAHISEEVDEFFRVIAYGIFQGYGLTETAPILALYDPSKNVAGSAGSFINNENIKIENGQLYVKGASVTPGYYKNKEKTANSFKDGWFATGDIVEVDKEGNVFIKGRKDDMIVKESGINIYPSDIEEKLKKHPAVKDCAVFGAHRDGRKKIIAVLLLEDSGMAKKEIDKIVQGTNIELNVSQKIDDYIIWRGQDFPRTSSTMDIKKKEILEEIEKSSQKGEADIGKAAMKDYSQKRDIYELINSIKRTAGKRDGQTSLEKDLGLDSLDIISLSTEIEKNYGIDASQLDLTADTKIADIEEKIKNPPKKSGKLPFYNFAYNWFFVGLRTVFQIFIFPFARLLYRTRIDGRDNLKQFDRPTVFISNHVSVMDTLVIIYSLPLKIRARLAVVMSIGHHFNRFFSGQGNIFRRLIEGAGFFLFISLFINVIPLARHAGFDQVFKNIGMAIDRGWNILIFPEGAVTLDGNIQEFEPGIGLICKDMKAPVIPLRIDGLFNILRNGLLPFGHMPKMPLVKVKISKQAYHKEGDYRQIAGKLYKIMTEEML